MSGQRATTQPASVGHHGWLTVGGPDDITIHARMSKRRGRVVITDLYMHGSEIDSSSLRSINTTMIRVMGGQIARDAAAAADQFAGILGEPATLEELRRRSPIPPRSRVTHRPPLNRPANYGDPSEFYSLVAEAYLEYAATRRDAAAAIAEEAGVPVTTAHRWVREARKRGQLPPGSKGRTG